MYVCVCACVCVRVCKFYVLLTFVLMWAVLCVCDFAVCREQTDSSTSNVARALHSFTAERSDELTIAPGDELVRRT